MTRQLLACEVAQRRSETINGLQLQFLQMGPERAPAVCFLHGGAAHAHWFDRVMPALGDRFHVISLDQRGHGGGPWGAPPAHPTPGFPGGLLAPVDRPGWVPGW